MRDSEGQDLDLPSMDHDAWGSSPGAGYAPPGGAAARTVGIQPRQTHGPRGKAAVSIRVMLGGNDRGMAPLDQDHLVAERLIHVPFYLCEDEQEGPAFYERVGLLGQLVQDVIGAHGAFEAELERKGHKLTESGRTSPFTNSELESLREAWDKRLASSFSTEGRYEVVVDGDQVICRPTVRRLGDDEVFCALCGKVVAPNEQRFVIGSREYCTRCHAKKVEWGQIPPLHAPGEDPDFCAHCGKGLEDETVVYQLEEGTVCSACRGEALAAQEARDAADGTVCAHCGILVGEDTIWRDEDDDPLCENCAAALEDDDD